MKSKNNYYKKDGEVGYAISIDRIEEWKRIVYFEQFNRGYIPNYDDERPKDIPPISNDSLLKDKNTFFTDPDESSYLNLIIKANLKMNVDYKIVDEEVWNFFHTKYGGTEIKRFYHKTYSFGAEVEAKLKEIKLVILPILEEWDKSKIDEPKSIFTSKYETFQHLINRITAIINSSQTQPSNITNENIKAWKLGYDWDLDKIIQDVTNAKDSNMEIDSESTDQESSNKNIQRNTGIKFHGTSLEMMKKFQIDDVELSSSDTLFIELASKITGKFIFYYEDIKILGYGKCEYWYSHKPLTVQCRWEEVKYCSEECMKKDERFHVDKWNAPIDSGNDAPFTKKDRASLWNNWTSKSRKYLIYELIDSMS